MIVLVRHPPVDAVGRCYGRLDLDVADPTSVVDLASRIRNLFPPPLVGGAGGGVATAQVHTHESGSQDQDGARGTPPPDPLPQGEGKKWTIWASPARRCLSVAEALGVHRIDKRLQELDFGAWEGLPWDNVPRASLDEWAADPWHFTPPGGESGATLVTRVRAFAAGCRSGHHIVVTHGGPLKVLRAVLSHAEIDLLAPPPPPGSITLMAN